MELFPIPSRANYKMNEVSSIAGIKAYVLRFWETEFIEISPQFSDTGEKIYSERDVEAVFLIKKLLYEDKLSIEKSKNELSSKLEEYQKFKESFPPMIPSFEKNNVIPVPTHDVINIDKDENKPSQPEWTFGLSESDAQKLVLAKSKLRSMVAMAHDLIN